MKQIGIWIALLFMASAVAAGAPQITQVSNTASYLDKDLPNGGLAQGAAFTILGTDLAPDGYYTPSEFPLDTAMEGVTIKVTVGSTTVDALPIVLYRNEQITNDVVTAVLPSNTPVGEGTVQLFYNGASNAFPVSVVANAPGIFALNTAGSGPGVFTNALTYAANTLLVTAEPNEQWDIWVTGLGAVSGDEAGGPLPGDLRGQYDVKVYVGGVEAVVTYAGRSGCCAGLDQIRFIVPASVTGCYVPVVLVVEGVPSNSVTMSIDSAGGVCSDVGGLTSDEITQAWQSGEFRVGSIALSRQSVEIPGLGYATTSDSGLANFELYDPVELISAESVAGIFPAGSCIVTTFQGDDPEEATDTDPVVPTGLDAGDVINLSGNENTRQLQKMEKGFYSESLGSNMGFGQPLFLDPGTYTATNGNGGADVGPFQASLTIPSNFTWTNQNAIDYVPGGQPLGITWDGPSTGYVWIMGTSTMDNEVGAAFFCYANAVSKQFSVPAYVVDTLPPNAFVEGYPTGFLSVGLYTEPTRFQAQGLDAGFISNSSAIAKNVSFHVEYEPEEIIIPTSIEANTGE